MKWLFTVLMCLGILAALCASLLVASLNSSGTATTQTTEVEDLREVDIMVAARSLPAASVVDASAVVAQKVKLTELPPGAIMSPPAVVGQVLAAPIVKGQPFTDSLLAANEPGMHLSAILPEGMRFMSIVLSSGSGLRGLLYPGGIVDVLASFRAQSSDDESSGQRVFSTILLQGIRILAVGTDSVVGNTTADGEDPVGDKRRQTVTVMVDAEQSEILQLAMTHGEISLAMRNPLDQSTSTVPGVLLTDISRRLRDSSVQSAPPPLLPAKVGNDLPPPRATRMDPDGLAFVEGEGGRAVLGEHTTTEGEKQDVWRVLVLRGPKREVFEFPAPKSANAVPE